MRKPSRRSVITFCMNITGVSRPWNIFISASISNCMIVSTSLPASATPPLSIALMAPPCGRNMRSASIMPCSVTAFAYLCAYGMHG